jgi:thiosulfate/3-mercaptopyruvate sulfurtransferase
MVATHSIVSAPWLYEHLHDASVAIADCRFSLSDPTLGRQQYDRSHIPGAYYFDLNQDLSSPVGKHGGRHPLPDPQALAQKLAAMGIDSTDPKQARLVVVYDDSRFAFASRFWWLLRYLGYNHVAVLDGGFQGWLNAGYPVDAQVPSRQSGKFVPNVQPDMVVDIEAVKLKKGLSDTVLVDSREAERYRGEHEPIDPIAGHIPGALNYPWMQITDAEGYSVSPEVHQRRWADINQAKEILVYCGSGVTACVNLLSMQVAGIEQGKLYAGSWSDWCSYL